MRGALATRGPARLRDPRLGAGARREISPVEQERPMSTLRHLDAIVTRERRQHVRTEAFVACLLLAIAVLAAVFA
jgi:hypothetical protein